MRKIKTKILIILSAIVFSGFLFNANSRALNNHSIEVFSNIYSATGPINVEFNYLVTPDSTNPAGATNEPTGLTIQFNNVTPTGNLTTETKELDFSATNYATPGIYRYLIREVSSSNSDYPVSSDEYEIYVIASGTGKNVYHLAKNMADDTKGEINFNHSPGYTYATISATTVGDAVDRDEYFRYKVEFGSICVGCSYNVIGQDEYIKYNNQVIRTSDIYTGSSGQNYMYIYLKNGQTVNIGLDRNGNSQIPIGTTIKVSIDENLNQRKWTLLIDDKEVSSAEFVLNGNITIRLIAERNLLVPNTGVFGELWPFAALVVMGVIGILLFVFTREKNE
ncbi:hypothetical protein IKF03_00400 [Candidatus Saccharibacteria bacterium]|nr:hypothetical protein [Candidatus Saccharibacteria bacterium]